MFWCFSLGSFKLAGCCEVVILHSCCPNSVSVVKIVEAAVGGGGTGPMRAHPTLHGVVGGTKAVWLQGDAVAVNGTLALMVEVVRVRPARQRERQRPLRAKRTHHTAAVRTRAETRSASHLGVAITVD